MLNATFRPLREWPGKPTPALSRRGSRFRAGYVQTLDLLERELDAIAAKDIVIQIAVELKDIRNDGWPRANCRPVSPGVVLSFLKGRTPLQFACDTFDDWECNLRAIALTLESLRAVDRYGATKRGEQYRGWAQLPPGEGYVPPRPPALTRTEAAEFLAKHAGFKAESILADSGVRDVAFQRAAQRLHPDAGGTHEAFLQLQRAREVLSK